MKLSYEKNNPPLKFFCAALMASLVCAPAITSAQKSENWYQIELLVFKRAASPVEREAWSKNLALAYPPNIQYLIEETEQAELEAESHEAATATGTPPTTTLPSPAQAQQETEKPFVVMESSKFFIENASSAIRRERGLQTLFHKTWAQPVETQENAPAIIIEGGDGFGELSELSGTITISLSRYLHLYTDLWLAEFEANYGQESYHWPKIPSPPVSPDKSELSSTSDFANTTDFQLGNTTTSDGFNLNLNISDASPSNSADNEWSSLTNKPYLVKQITTLTQKRRMRSNELHYIDHPKMGILVKIIPYTPKHLQPENEE